jgi:uracil-DNA glycosylase
MVMQRIVDRLWAEEAAGRAWCRVRRADRPASTAPAASTFAGAPAGAEADSLERLVAEVVACRRCALGGQRRNAVPGEGGTTPRLMFVGEAPGEEEDRQGRPFVGRAGELLTKMIAAMGYSREQVFIANVLKCRPPGNRAPTPEEVAACKDYLRRQLTLLSPEVVVALGAHAARWLLARDVGINAVRGQVFDRGTAKIVPTYHPSYLLRVPEDKAKAWADLQVAMRLLAKS